MLQFCKLSLINLVLPSKFALQNSDLSAMVAHHAADGQDEEECHGQQASANYWYYDLQGKRVSWSYI